MDTLIAANETSIMSAVFHQHIQRVLYEDFRKYLQPAALLASSVSYFIKLQKLQ